MIIVVIILWDDYSLVICVFLILGDQGLIGLGGPHDLSCFGAKMSKEDSTVYNLKVFHSLQEQALNSWI